MGEAAKNVPDSIKDRHLDLPWKRMAGMRDKLIHGYSDVGLEIVWSVLTDRLPAIRPGIEQMLAELDRQDA